MLVCALYCLLTFPDTSSHQGMMRRVKAGRPSATSRIGLGISAVQLSGESKIGHGDCWEVCTITVALTSESWQISSRREVQKI